MTGFQDFTEQEPFISSLPKLLQNDKSANTCNAGTSFPTVGVSDGMLCFRIDQNKLYIYSSTSWKVLLDFNDMPIKKSEQIKIKRW